MQNNNNNRKTTSLEPNTSIQMSTTWVTWLAERHTKIKALLLRVHSKNMSVLKLEPPGISLLTPTAPNSDAKLWPTLKAVSEGWLWPASPCTDWSCTWDWISLFPVACPGTMTGANQNQHLGLVAECHWAQQQGRGQKRFPTGTAHGTAASAQHRAQQSIFHCPSMQF